MQISNFLNCKITHVFRLNISVDFINFHTKNTVISFNLLLTSFRIQLLKFTGAYNHLQNENIVKPHRIYLFLYNFH